MRGTVGSALIDYRLTFALTGTTVATAETILGQVAYYCQESTTLARINSSYIAHELGVYPINDLFNTSHSQSTTASCIQLKVLRTVYTTPAPSPPQQIAKHRDRSSNSATHIRGDDYYIIPTVTSAAMLPVVVVSAAAEARGASVVCRLAAPLLLVVCLMISLSEENCSCNLLSEYQGHY